MTAEIKKIVIEIDGKEIVLTVEQAKKLKDALNEIYKRPVKEYIPCSFPAPSPHPYIPWVTYADNTAKDTIEPPYTVCNINLSGGTK